LFQIEKAKGNGDASMGEFDNHKREHLLRTMEALGTLPERNSARTPLPVVSLEDFFDGNNDYGSIGCNLAEEEHPGPDGFYAILRAIRQRPDVQDVLVEVYEVNEGYWPYSERVYVLSRSALADVSRWLASLHPTEVSEGYPFHDMPSLLPPCAPGMKVYAAWWD
jgi:hypothetical protein